ncbi:MAG: efflux RND transporter periplasmic adaptor subunit [Christensenellales bacterium]|jgi:multidrug efflux pump subunit AcrA (membrane-fusion protein)
MKKHICWLLPVFILLIQCCGCTAAVKREGGLTAPSTETIDIEYATKEIFRGDVEASAAGYGMFQAAHPVAVYYTYTGGRVKAVNATYYMNVEAGDVLMELDTEELEFNMRKLDILYAQREFAFNKYSKSSNALTRMQARWTWDSFLLDYNKTKAALESAVLRAPVGGTIIQNATVLENNYVGTYTTLFTIADVHDLILVVSKDSELQKLANIAYAGMPVKVTITGKSYDGLVVQSPMDASTRTEKAYVNNFIYVKVYDLPEDEDLLFKEARISVTTASAKDALLVPNSCIYTYNNKSYVYVIREGIQIEQPIQVGITDEVNTEVISGLEEGDQVRVRR